MERKRKLPARAAARVEQAAKRRTSTPPTDSVTTRSATPAQSAIDTEDEAKSQPDGGPQRQSLPRSIQPGKPLPTVERAQPEDLSGLDYQSVQESGVLAESLLRSRQKWLHEGIFERYWTKPSKRKGVAADDPKNPPKDSMVKLGQVVLTVEPHMFEVTVYGVKDPKPAAALPANRPVIMYGPSRGMMPPPSVPGTPTMPKQPKKKRLPSKSPAPMPPTLPGMHAHNMAMTPIPPPQIPQISQTAVPTPPHPSQLAPPLPPQPQTPAMAMAAAPPSNGSPCPPTPSPKPVLQPPNISHHTPPPALSQLQTGLLRPQSVPPTAAATAASTPRPLAPANGTKSNTPANGVSPSPSMVQVPAMSPAMSPAPGSMRQPSLPPNGARPAPTPSPGPTGTPRPAPATPGSDSIIVTLAERASGDPELRDLMKRVANKQAPKEELDRFQAIINQITMEKQRDSQAASESQRSTPSVQPSVQLPMQPPSADRLIVDGRTVRYFAEEVRAILDIVLRSNPRQTSADLRPPVGSDPLVVLLVKAALDDVRVRDMVRRIGENVPQMTDATDLESLLIRLKNQLVREQEAYERQQRQQAAAAAGPGVPLAPAGGMPMAVAQPHGGQLARGPPLAPGTPQNGQFVAARVNGASNGVPGTPPSHRASAASQPQAQRAKAPAVVKMHDVSALVFEFAGGTGDRYLYPKYSVLQYVPATGSSSSGGSPPAAELVSSFLLVRKGSASEYGGDPDLDYYQPITVRIQVSAQAQSHSNQHILDYFARVVAPADEVARYMDNIMNSMTRAEYVLLAMRLPRKTLPGPNTSTTTTTTTAGGSSNSNNSSSDVKNDDDSSSFVYSSGDKTTDSDRKTTTTRANNRESSYTVGQPHAELLQGVLWAASAGNNAARPKGVGSAQQHAVKQMVDEDQQYQGFIAGLIPRAVEEEA